MDSLRFYIHGAPLFSTHDVLLVAVCVWFLWKKGYFANLPALWHVAMLPLAALLILNAGALLITLYLVESNFRVIASIILLACYSAKLMLAWWIARLPPCPPKTDEARQRATSTSS